MPARVRFALIAGACGVALAAAMAPGSVVAAPSQAHIARALKASSVAHLRYISAKGSVLLEEGPATGTLPGKMVVNFDVGPTFKGTFTIHTRGGEIIGHGTAVPHGAGVTESFAGTLVASGGTGRYKHARGRAKLFGTFNRNTYALTVQTTGTLSY
jgi:hypothetical protein